MTNSFNPIASRATLGDQLRRKSRSRREGQERMALVSAAHRRRNDMLPRLELSYVPLEELRPSARKLRKLDPAHVREVASSISLLGFCDPLLVGGDNSVIDGEARYAPAKQLGLDRVPCVRVEHLHPDEQRVLRLAINRLAETGQWDLDALKIEFEELILLDAPIEITGFSPAEIDHVILGDAAEALEQGPLEPDPATAVARIGDMFQLGPHRVVCGDATDPAVLTRLLEAEDAPARLVLTDEPYNVKIAGHVTGGGHREFAMASGEMTDAEFFAFNEAWMAAVLPHLCDGGILGTFIDWRGSPTVHSAATKLGLVPQNLIVWAKTNAGMGSLYRSQHELLPLFKKGTAPHVNNVELGKRGRWRSNVWTYPGASSLGSDARRGLKDHPTVKPTAMLEDALLDSPIVATSSSIRFSAPAQPSLPPRRPVVCAAGRAGPALRGCDHPPSRGRDRQPRNSRRNRRGIQRTRRAQGKGSSASLASDARRASGGGPCRTATAPTARGRLPPGGQK